MVKPTVRLRPAQRRDCRRLWEWVNDPDVRRAAFDSHPISWDEHVAWFRRKQGDTACRIYIVVNRAGRPVGQVRFELRPRGVAEVDLSVAGAHRRQGIGAAALQLACAQVVRDACVRQVLARIKPGNLASRRTFEQAGFVRRGRHWRWSHQPAYVVAACRPWNRTLFTERIRRLPGRWHFIGRPQDLTLRRLARLAPAAVFFLHWSWKVPPAIVRRYECVAFHMTDLPYGRGGSPLQHLILRGHRTTMLSALRMTERFDAGPIYGKRPLSLAGTAQDSYLRASKLAIVMMRQILARRPTPVPQRGRVVRFARRTPADSCLPAQAQLRGLYDFIRMLDAQGYPRAFLRHGRFRYEFSQARLRDGRLTAFTTIVPARKRAGG